MELELSQEHIKRIDEFRRRKDTAVLVIMFTDLKESTALAENRGDEYALRMIRAHNQMLLELIERDGRGLVIRTVGDAFLGVFSEPSAAVKTAVEIQRELKEYSERSPEDEDMIVRIGLHMGQVSVEDQVQPDIFGRHVNRAARISDLAGGGHIYLSHSVYENASGWLKEKDLVWQDHGKYKVKGVAEPLRIYEVADESIISPRAPSQRRYVPLSSKITVAIAVTCLITLLMVFLTLRQPNHHSGVIFADTSLPIGSKLDPIIYNASGDTFRVFYGRGDGRNRDIDIHTLLLCEKTLDAAKANPLVEGNPVIIEAIPKVARQKGNTSVFISEDDAKKLEQLNEEARFLEKGKVVIAALGKPYYTGVIFNAAGSGIKPVMAPDIYYKSGGKLKLFYGMNDGRARDKNMYAIVTWDRTLDTAKNSKRVKGKPIVIEATRLINTMSSLLISEDDARKLEQINRESRFLEEGRAVIIR